MKKRKKRLGKIKVLILKCKIKRNQDARYRMHNRDEVNSNQISK